MIKSFGCMLTLCLALSPSPERALTVVSSDLPSKSRTLLAEGIAHPWRSVAIGAPLEGVLQEIVVTEGDHVEKGTMLARMDDRVARAALYAAEHAARRTADIAYAQTEHERATLILQRLLESARSQGATTHEVDIARLNVRQAEARLDDARERQVQAELDADLHRARVDQHRITASMTGEVVRMHAEAGIALRVAEPIMMVVDRSVLESELYLPASVWRSVHPGKRVELDAGPPVNAPLFGRIAHVSPVIDAATSLVRVVVRIDNADRSLPSGFVVHLHDHALTTQLTAEPTLP